jgi:bifunctional DNA-binding transcriptional regulator/antitoxin component of YhaV-PrlF toxin-antitoxin module
MANVFKEIRILNLHIAELSREILVTRKMELVIPKLAREKLQLQELLREKQEEGHKMSLELESPSNEQRWRSLYGQEPNQEELADKIRKLEEKIAQREVATKVYHNNLLYYRRNYYKKRLSW